MTTQQTPMHFPIDECAKCTVRGDMGGCLATRCSLHENWYARTQQDRITDLEAQLEAIGAGGVSGPLIGQPQAMPDLSQLTERGAKAWAGVDAQGLREGFTAADMATASAQGFRDGVAKGQQARWQPIETAPKDGQAILVTDGMDCYCVEWDEEFDWWTVDDNKLGPFRLRGSAPTHWMKLPEAPNA